MVLKSSVQFSDSVRGGEDVNVPIRQDDRRIEVIANGLPLWGGAQLAVDTTLVSTLTAAGLPRRVAGGTAGAALLTARRAKERTYPELCGSGHCRLTVVALELGGCWSTEAATFVRLLARCKARSAPPPFTSRRHLCLHVPMVGPPVLLFACHRHGQCRWDGELPPLSDILTDSTAQPPHASRLA